MIGRADVGIGPYEMPCKVVRADNPVRSGRDTQYLVGQGPRALPWVRLLSGGGLRAARPTNVPQVMRPGAGRRGNRRSAASGGRSKAISRKCPDWQARQRLSVGWHNGGQPPAPTEGYNRFLQPGRCGHRPLRMDFGGIPVTPSRRTGPRCCCR